MKRFTLATAAVAAALTLAACGGGSSPLAPPADGDGAGPPAEPATPAATLRGIVEGADTLRATGAHLRWTLTDGEATIGESTVETLTCAGARCVGEDGAATAVADLSGAFAGAGAAYATRGGLDTAKAQSAFEETGRVSGIAVTAGATAESWGLWGAHGLALLTLGAGPLSASVGGTAYTGDFSSAQAWALGAATGANPAELGSAVWRGTAEAASTATFERLAGTATVTIADLARPRVGVAIDVPGHAIDRPGWADMALANGRFETGTAGSDRLSGAFHGPAHEEAWGVFDTADYVGGFGAKRE